MAPKLPNFLFYRGVKGHARILNLNILRKNQKAMSLFYTCFFFLFQLKMFFRDSNVGTGEIGVSVSAF